MARTVPLIAATAAAAIYAAAFWYWTVVQGASPGEVPILGAIFIVIFPGAALLATLGTRPLARRVEPHPLAPVGLIVCLALVVFFTAFGAPGIAGLVGLDDIAEPALGWFELFVKLAIFVAVPLLIFAGLMRNSASSFGWARPAARMLGPRHLIVIIVIAGLFTLIQLFAGEHGPAILNGAYSPRDFALGYALAFLWYSIEAGVVEEVFFRTVLQERLAAIFRSDFAGLVFAVILFGLAHAPGLWLRGDFAEQGFLAAAAYSVLTLAPAGVVFGVIWIRTRNLLALILIHGSVDAIPHMQEVASRFGFSLGG